KERWAGTGGPPLPTVVGQPAQPWILLLQVGWTAKVPVGSVMVCRCIHAHLSAFSAPLASSQPLFGNGSVTASEYSCPETMLNPSSLPRTELAPQDVPRSSTYGMLVN